MAKKEAKQETKEMKFDVSLISGSNDENIVDTISKMDVFTQEEIAAGEEMEKEETKKENARKWRILKGKATYLNLLMVLKLRYSRSQERAVKACLDKSKELVIAIGEGKLGSTEFEKQLNDEIRKQNEKISEAYKEFTDHKKKLQEKFPSGNWWEWESPFRRLNASTVDQP